MGHGKRNEALHGNSSLHQTHPHPDPPGVSRRRTFNLSLEAGAVGGHPAAKWGSSCFCTPVQVWGPEY